MLLKSSNAIPYQTIVALAESPRAKGLIYAGTDDGRLHVTRDGGATWTELTRALPDPQMDLARGAVAARRRHGLRHPARPRRRRLRRLRLQVDRLRQDVHQHRRATSGRIGERDPRGSDRRQHGCSSAPTSARSCRTTAAKHWQVLGGNLPSVQVSDLQYQPRDRVIVISTYGRGMWAMDAVGIK